MPTEKEICIPNIGGATNINVIEIQVAVGDVIEKEDSLITLEGDKATMEIPSPYAGTVKAVNVAVGDKVSEGTSILIVGIQDDALPSSSEDKITNAKEPNTSAPADGKQPAIKNTQPKPSVSAEIDVELQDETIAMTPSTGSVHAGPAVRRMARELGVDLSRLIGSGEKGRIVKSDVDNYVKQQLSAVQSRAAGLGDDRSVLFSSTPAPAIDFSQFGNVEIQGLSRIKKLSGASLHRNWVSVPHVTQFGQADITELEAFRKQHKATAKARGIKLTPIAFVMKTIVAALKEFPSFNASLDVEGEHLILKKYFHIGVAVDTPNGLVVPVIRNVDKKGVFELAEEITTISHKAREKGLSIAEMQGGCFTISSLGGIGGTAFTPIINSPEVAILGLSTAQMKPVYSQDKFMPRLMLPLSLSYDHRVIDGAEGARFLVYLASCLSDVRKLLL